MTDKPLFNNIIGTIMEHKYTTGVGISWGEEPGVPTTWQKIRGITPAPFQTLFVQVLDHTHTPEENEARSISRRAVMQKVFNLASAAGIRVNVTFTQVQWLLKVPATVEVDKVNVKDLPQLVKRLPTPSKGKKQK